MGASPLLRKTPAQPQARRTSRGPRAPRPASDTCTRPCNDTEPTPVIAPARPQPRPLFQVTHSPDPGVLRPVDHGRVGQKVRRGAPPTLPKHAVQLRGALRDQILGCGGGKEFVPIVAHLPMRAHAPMRPCRPALLPWPAPPWPAPHRGSRRRRVGPRGQGPRRTTRARGGAAPRSPGRRPRGTPRRTDPRARSAPWGDARELGGCPSGRRAQARCARSVTHR